MTEQATIGVMGKQESASGDLEKEDRGSFAQDASVPPKLMTARQLSQFLQISRTTIYRMCDQGLIPYYEVGKRKRFDPMAVLSAINRHR